MCPREVVVGCNRSLEYAIFSGKSGQVRGSRPLLDEPPRVHSMYRAVRIRRWPRASGLASVRYCCRIAPSHSYDDQRGMAGARTDAQPRTRVRREVQRSLARGPRRRGAPDGNILSFNRPNMGAVKNVRADPGEVDAGSRKPAIDAAATHPRRRATEAHAPKRRRRVDQRAAAKARSPRVAAGTRSGRYAPTARSTRFPK